MSSPINPPRATQRSWNLSFSVIVMLIIGISLLSIAITIILSLIPLYLPTRTINTVIVRNEVTCQSNPANEQIQILPSRRSAADSRSQKIRINCPIVILGVGASGSHSAYRLAPTHPKQICVFDRNNYIGGRAYDRTYDGDSPDAYSASPISAQGSIRFYDAQSVMKQLASELQIVAAVYDYKTTVFNVRGRSYTSMNQMCSLSYTNLTCTNDTGGLNPSDQIWKRLLIEYRKNPSALYRYGDLPAYCRAIVGDETCSFLQDSIRFRSYFLNINAQGFLEHYDEDFQLMGPANYPINGMSQFPKRMLFNATKSHDVHVYLNEEVLSIDDVDTGTCYPFSIETTRCSIRANQLIAAMDPLGWTNVAGSIANDVKNDAHFQSIRPVKVVTVQAYWPRRWWEESAMFGANVDRVWTRQNCLSIVEIFSARPEQKFQNLTRIVYDDGQCVELWAALMARSSQEELVAEILRGIRAIFTDVKIPEPTKVLTKLWNGAWHFQTGNSVFTNKQISRWALNPLSRFNRNQFSLIGEAFFLDRALWTEAAIKSSLVSLTSQFNLKFDCYQGDVSPGGVFCPSNFV